MYTINPKAEKLLKEYNQIFSVEDILDFLNNYRTKGTAEFTKCEYLSMDNRENSGQIQSLIFIPEGLTPRTITYKDVVSLNIGLESVQSKFGFSTHDLIEVDAAAKLERIFRQMIREKLQDSEANA